MPTPLDNAMKSKNVLLAFGAIITAATAWSIWGTGNLGPEPDPTGDPEGWSTEELRRWLSARSLFPAESATRQELLDRIAANMRVPRA